MSHLSPDQLSAYIDGALADADREVAESHFATCAECLRELSELARVHRQLQAALDHDPGEAYFDAFAGRVQDRIRGDAVLVRAGTLPRRAPTLLDRLGGWFSGPRLAWAGTAAAVVIGAGVVFMVSRETPLEKLRSPEIESRTRQVEGRDESAPSPAPAPLAKREDAPRTALEEEMDGSVNDVAVKAKESKETDQLTASAKLDKDERPAELTSADQRSNASAPAAGSQFAETPPVAGTTSTAPAAGQKKTPEKNQAREMRRVEGENLPAPESQTTMQKAAPPSAGTSNFSAPPKDAAARAKTEQMKQVAEPLQASATQKVCGTVRDDSGRPLPGAQVVIADLGVTARADASGRFCVDAPAGTHTLAAMAVGFNEVRREVQVGGRTRSVEFKMSAVSVLADAKRSDWPPPARDLAQDAEAGARRAQATNNPASWDSVALQWSKTAATLSPGEALVRARANLAEARYRAWKLSPTPGRTGVAAAAIQSYLEVAPQGTERRKAQQRLDEVEQR